MKYAAIFAIVAFAFLAQANARSFESLDRGAIANALKAKLAAAKESLTKFLETASDKLKVKIVEIQKKAEELIDQLKQNAGKISNGVYAASEKLINKIEKFEDKYLTYFQQHESKVVEDKVQEFETVAEVQEVETVTEAQEIETVTEAQ